MKRRGATAVEFALLLPVLVLFLTGLLDTVGYLHARAVLVDAAVAGARAAAVAPDPTTLATEAEAAVEAALATFGQGARTPSVTVARDTATTDVVEVEVSVDHAPLVGLVPFPTRITVHASALYENPDG